MRDHPGDVLARAEVGQRRPARVEPELAGREQRQLVGAGRRAAGRVDPRQAGAGELAGEHRVGALRGRAQDEPARLHVTGVPVVEVPLEHELAAAARGEPERPAVELRPRRRRRGDRERRQLVEPRHRVLQRHAQVPVVEHLDADRAVAGRVQVTRAADDPELGPRVGRVRARPQRAQPRAAEVRGRDRRVVAPADPLAQVERPDEPALADVPRLGEVRLDAASRRSASGPRRARARRSATAGRSPSPGRARSARAAAPAGASARPAARATTSRRSRRARAPPPRASPRALPIRCRAACR